MRRWEPRGSKSGLSLVEIAAGRSQLGGFRHLLSVVLQRSDIICEPLGRKETGKPLLGNKSFSLEAELILHVSADKLTCLSQRWKTSRCLHTIITSTPLLKEAAA